MTMYLMILYLEHRERIFNIEKFNITELAAKEGRFSDNQLKVKNRPTRVVDPII